MQGYEQDVPRGVEDVLGAVAVMVINVQNGRPAPAEQPAMSATRLAETCARCSSAPLPMTIGAF